jgi:adenine-specific DNA-methyltransferase
MPVLQFKGKTAVENYHYTVPHHALEFDAKLSVLPKDAPPSLEGNVIIEGDNLLALKALLPTHAGRIKCIYIDPPTTPATKVGSITTTSLSRSSRNGSARGD